MFTPQNVRPVTSVDVAREAGVSRATVSFVLNDRPDARVSPATRERVLQAAARLGYTPNVAARALRLGESRGIVIPLPGPDLGVDISLMLQMLMKQASLRGLDVQVLLSQARGGAGATQWTLQRPRGVIAMADTCDEEATLALRAVGVKGLIVIGPHPVSYAPHLTLDQAELAQAAVAHLHALGHRRLRYVYPHCAHAAGEVSARRTGLRQAATASGITVDEVCATPEPASLRGAAAHWMRTPGHPTAAICHDDTLAFALIHALSEAGVRVPRDVAVIGQGNHPVAQSFVPGLSTVWRDLRPMATVLLDALGHMFAGEVVSAIPAPPAAVIARAST